MFLKTPRFLSKVTVALKDGYAWKDGTTDPVEFTWNIKALQTQKPVVVNGLTYNGKKSDRCKREKDVILQAHTLQKMSDLIKQKSFLQKDMNGLTAPQIR